ncbi:hypothetical protein [Roseibium sp.]|uniref:hypothetical protein n=1 Tax=Roseibium sp. TaxID=1936156 RepID=UPI003B51204F
MTVSGGPVHGLDRYQRIVAGLVKTQKLIRQVRRAAAVSGQGWWCPVLSRLSPQIPQ